MNKAYMTCVVGKVVEALPLPRWWQLKEQRGLNMMVATFLLDT